MRAPSDNVVVCTGTTIHKLREVKIEMTCESRMSWFNYFGLFLSLLVSRFELLFSCCTWKANIIDSTYEYRLISVRCAIGLSTKKWPDSLFSPTWLWDTVVTTSVANIAQRTDSTLKTYKSWTRSQIHTLFVSQRFGRSTVTLVFWLFPV